MSGLVLRSLFLVERNKARVKVLAALSNLAPSSMFWLLSGGVLALCALYE